MAPSDPEPAANDAAAAEPASEEQSNCLAEEQAMPLRALS